MNPAERQPASPPGADARPGVPWRDWHGKAQWRILEVGFGHGENFLDAWRAWREDPRRPAMLHYVATVPTASPVESLHRAWSANPLLAPLAQSLAQQWFGLLPGFHRLAFEEDRVLLTLCVGAVRASLRELAFNADGVLLSAGDTDLHRLKAVARLCRPGTTLSARSHAEPRPADLRQCGFASAGSSVRAAPEPSAALMEAVFDPPWQAKRPAPLARVQPGACAVVGGGLAGTAVAASLARRGWAVEVFDAAECPASGASGLPAGLLVAHQSPDDSLLSRLSRAGVRMTLSQAAGLLRHGEDWRLTGVMAHRSDAQEALPADAPPELAAWSRMASPDLKAHAGLGDGCPALWHERAGWIRPAALVHAWLAQPGIRWRGGVRVARLERDQDRWRLWDDAGVAIARVPLVVVAAAHDSAALLPVRLPLQPVRGQVSWCADPPAGALPPFPVNGEGYFLPGVPAGPGMAWLCGASFDRDDADTSARPQDDASNLARLERLLPLAAALVGPLFGTGNVRSWTGVRCASSDRRPLVGELAPGLWVSTAMGSRGLSYAHLGAELIAARLHAEPLPLPRRLAASVDVRRALVDPGA